MTRRRSSLAALLLIATVVLHACGDDGGATPPATAEGSEPEHRTVTHAMGTTEVPQEPQRVVVLDSSFLDASLALDVVPVGATEASAGVGMPEYLADRVPEIDTVGLTEEPNIEAIAALRPDLVLGAKVRHEALYDELSAIAPTVFTESSGTNWKQGLAVTADALGMGDEAARLLSDYEDRAGEIGDRIDAGDTHLSMVRFLLPDEIRIYGPETFSGTVLTDVGFDLGDHAWDEYSMAYVSAEQLGRVDADAIFATSYGGSDAPEDDASFDAVRPLWQAVPAVAGGNQHWVEDDVWMLGIGPVGAGLVLDDIEDRLGA